MSEEVKFPSDVFVNSPFARMQENLQHSLGLSREFVVPVLLSAASVAAGKGIEVASSGGRSCRGNLYILLGAPSGFGKSELGGRVFEPHYRIASEKSRAFLYDKKPKLNAQKRLIEAKLKKLEKLDSEADSGLGELERLSKALCELDSEYVPPKVVVEDCTQEAFERAFSFDGTVAMISTDGRSVSKNIFGRYRPGSTEEDVLIKAWSRDRIIVDRMSRSLWIDDPCLSMCVCVQPDLFIKIFSKSDFRESGLLPRILPVLVDSVPGIVGVTAGLNRPTIDEYNQHVEATFAEYRFREQRCRVELEAKGKQLIEVFQAEAFLDGRREPSISVCAHRWAEQAYRVALCLHIAHYGKYAHHYPISEYFAHKAIELLRWFGQQQREFLQAGIEEEKRDLKLKMRDIVFGDSTAEVTVRMLSRRLGRRSDQIKMILDEMEDLEIEKVLTTGGAPKFLVRKCE